MGLRVGLTYPSDQNRPIFPAHDLLQLRPRVKSCSDCGAGHGDGHDRTREDGRDESVPAIGGVSSSLGESVRVGGEVPRRESYARHALAGRERSIIGSHSRRPSSIQRYAEQNVMGLEIGRGAGEVSSPWLSWSFLPRGPGPGRPQISPERPNLWGPRSAVKRAVAWHHGLTDLVPAVDPLAKYAVVQFSVGGGGAAKLANLPCPLRT